MKLNLGCGSNKLDGWVNIDKSALCCPYQVADLEVLPWPWPDDSASEVQLSHVLEHLGQTPDSFIGIMRELWRICRNQARISIRVPDCRHDDFFGDPTHVRPINDQMLGLFDQQFNRWCIEQHHTNTPLGLMHGIDFSVESKDLVLDSPWAEKRASGEMNQAQIDEAIRMYNNVIKEARYVLVARKVK